MIQKIISKYWDNIRYNDSEEYNKLVNISDIVEKIIIFLVPIIILPIISKLLLGEHLHFFLILIGLAGMIIIFFLNKYRLFKYTFLLLYSLFSVLMALIIITGDGIRDITLFIYPVIIMFTAFVLDLRVFVITSIINFVILISISLAEYTGLMKLRLSEYVDFEFISDLIVILIVINFVVYVMIYIAQSRERKLKESNYTKDRFLKILAHDLRSPFQQLIGSANLLNEHYNELPEGDKKILIQQLAYSVDRQYELLESLLNWGKLQTGMFKTIFLEFNLWRVAEEAIKQAASAAKEKNISVSNNINKNFTMRGDEFLVSTAIRNFLSNSLKYTNEGGQIEISANDYDNNIEIVLEDNGIGMDSDKIKEINDSLAVNSVPGLQGEIGYGIGLSMIKEIVKIHKGTLEIESEPGKGSRFIIRIPRTIIE
ncbi:MAG: HAMP domain-containing histidine kinase [Melioribacteraceae bacterium]|nr:HAMP domain-containing histidine kinase [Melioribacteraceae bacterium]